MAPSRPSALGPGRLLGPQPLFTAYAPPPPSRGPAPFPPRSPSPSLALSGAYPLSLGSVLLGGPHPHALTPVSLGGPSPPLCFTLVSRPFPGRSVAAEGCAPRVSASSSVEGFSRPREPGPLPGAGPRAGGGAELLAGTTPSQASSHLFCGVWAPHCFRTSALTASTSLASADPPQVKAGGRLAPSPASVGTFCAWG